MEPFRFAVTTLSMPSPFRSATTSDVGREPTPAGCPAVSLSPTAHVALAGLVAGGMPTSTIAGFSWTTAGDGHPSKPGRRPRHTVMISLCS